MKIDDMTVGEARELAALFGRGVSPRARKPEVPLPFKAGDAVLFRTVTMIQLGRVVSIGSDFIVLTDGGWVAETARFSEMLETGALNEFERVDLPWFLVGRGAIVDAFPWMHAIPKETK